jgi:plasmid stabilization system protein ParE
VRHRLILRPEARVDLREVAFWYNEQGAGLGERFVEDLERIFERISENPRQFPRVDQTVHCALLRQFPYKVYFRLHKESVRVLAILHQRRHPDTWRQR